MQPLNASRSSTHTHRSPDVNGHARPGRTREERVLSAWSAIERAQSGGGKRPEDDVVNLVPDGRTVSVVLKARTACSDSAIEKAVRAHLKAAGLTGVRLDFVRPAIDPVPTSVRPRGGASGTPEQRVERALKNLEKVQQRLGDVDAPQREIQNLALHEGTVAIVVGPRARHSDAALKRVTAALLKEVGLTDVELEVVRPQINPMPRGTFCGTSTLSSVLPRGDARPVGTMRAHDLRGAQLRGDA